MKEPRETIFRITWQYAAFSVLTFFAVSSSLLLVAGVGFRSSLSAAVVLAAEVVGLVWLLRRLNACGIFVEHGQVVLRTVTRTTSIPLPRLRIYEDRVSLVAKADTVPALSDVTGRATKAGVLTGLDQPSKVGIVRTLRHIRDADAAGSLES